MLDMSLLVMPQQTTLSTRSQSSKSTLQLFMLSQTLRIGDIEAISLALFNEVLNTKISYFS